MQKVAAMQYVKIEKSEYAKLKQLEKCFGDFLRYAQHIKDIETAREDYRQGRYEPQEEVFKKLGI